MAKLQLPSAEYIRQLLDYNPVTVELRWRVRPSAMFAEGKNGPETSAKVWNSRWAGEPAGSITPLGYARLEIGKQGYMAHRIAWIHFYGAAPVGEIDHINGEKSDNRIANLRDVTASDNCKNKPLPKKNTSGFVGVSFHKTSGKWMAYFGSLGKKYYLGLFMTAKDASEARESAAKVHGFTERHGKT